MSDEIEEYVWDIALSRRLDTEFWGETASGTREAVILNIHKATNHERTDSGMVPIGDFANMIINLWWHMSAKAETEKAI